MVAYQSVGGGARWYLRATHDKREVYVPSQVGTPMDPDNFVKRLHKPLLKRAGLPQMSFHCLRHTFATLMMPNGHPKIVQEMLGHSRVSDPDGNQLQVREGRGASRR